MPYKAFNRLRQTKTCLKILTPLGKPLSPMRWIFIIGCYNSGTTLLDHILAQHPSIAGLQEEGVWLTDSLPRPEDFGCTRMWHKCLENVSLQPGQNMEQLAARIKRQWSIWYPADPANCLEKSIANATHMLFLQEYFHPAYFIYIVRNGYAVSEGIRRKSNLSRWKNPYYKKTYSISLCAEQWEVSDELITSEAIHLNRFLQIYYEDLCDKPEYVLSRITDFLGIDPLPRSIFHRAWSVHEKVSSIQNMNHQSIKCLSEQDIQAIAAVAGNRLIKHDYTSPLG